MNTCATGPGLLAAPVATGAVFLVTAALVLPASFPRCV